MSADVIARGGELTRGYVVIEHMSRNRALDVYDVWSSERECRCVAKVLAPGWGRSLSARRRLLREGRLLVGLGHPHLVSAYEVRLMPRLVVILETLSGETLAHMIARRKRRLSARELGFLGLHLCSAVHYLHSRGILHLDLKPSNVISDGGRAKVIDLSIARRPGRVRKGSGTRQYMAPEQFGGGRVTTATDAWGIGAVLFHAATGARPFDPDREGRRPQLRRRAASVAVHRRLPAALGETIDRCLEPDPDSRPAVEEIRDALRNALECPQPWLARDGSATATPTANAMLAAP